MWGLSLIHIFYIGQSRDIHRRWRKHFERGAAHSKAFQEDILLLGFSGFDFKILEECREDELLEKEAAYIAALKPPYNSVFAGHEVSDKTRQKISASLKGRKQPDVLIAKRRAGILKRHETVPQTNAGHRKKVFVDDVLIESVKAAAEYVGTDAASMTRALKRGRRIKNHTVRYAV